MAVCLPRHRSALCGVLMVLLANPALAWNAGGHRISGIITHDALPPQVRDRVLTLLQQHPRFQEDFLAQVPQDIGSDRNAWLFAQAAVWPDVAREFKGNDRQRYHHAGWHFINACVFLAPGDETQAPDLCSLNTKWEENSDPDSLNIVQALQLCLHQLKSEDTPAADKAVLLCWLFHLVGDLHQPLHTVALIAPQRFPKGDRGGNDIEVSRSQNLHSRWDGLLGQGKNWSDARARAAQYTAEFSGAASFSGSQDFLKWMEESQVLARKQVYTAPLLEHVRKYEGVAGKLPAVDLGQAYYQQAGATARVRIVEAGLRLAEVLKEIFP